MSMISSTYSMVGRRFGLLTVKERAGTHYTSNALWLCRCDCGGTKAVPTSNLTAGNTRSCGCLKKRAK